MNAEYIEEIEHLINKFITYSCQLNQCMQEDQSHFLVNDLLAIEQSNLKKEALNLNLQELFRQLSAHDAIQSTQGDLFTRLACYAKTLSDCNDTRLAALIKTMRETNQTGLELMHLNRQVVYTNLAYVKELLSNLTLSHSNSKNNTYDQMGLVT